MKILRISTVPHSLNLLLKGQFRYLTSKGFEVKVASSYDGTIPELENRENVRHYSLPLNRTLNPLKDLKALFKTIQLINKLKPDVVHTHSPKAGIIGMMAAYLCRVPLKIHTVAGLPVVEERGLKKTILIGVERMTYFCSDYVLPNSINQQNYILKKLYNHKKVQVIGKGSSNGIDLEYFDPRLYDEQDVITVKESLGIPSENLVLCFVGRLAHYKGINELVEAFQELNKIYKSINLLLVGPFEELNPLDPKSLSIIENNKNIKSVGHQNDIRPFLIASDVFIFPSYREGFPQSLMQAAAMQLPCIATDINGCNEIIEHGETGFLIEPKSTSAIITATQTLIEDRKLRTKLAANSRKNMEDNFEQINFWNKIISFYRSNGKNIH